MSDQPTLPFDLELVARPLAARVPAPVTVLAPETVAVSDSVPESAPEFAVRIVRSKRRKKSVGAHIVDGVVEVVVPMWMSKGEAERFAEKMRTRFERKRVHSDTDLLARARSLARTHELPQPASVRWVTNQNTRWGSCTPLDGSIRLSERLQKAPSWVVDYVLVHELAHLRHPDHSPAFWATVGRYPRTERARGFLLGMGFADDEPDQTDESDESG